MENASKALLMAGAILIAILLISAGIIIFNSTTGLQDEVGRLSDGTAIKTFNSNFENYAGTNVPKAQVQSLLSTIIASNAKSDIDVGVYLMQGTNIIRDPQVAMSNLSYSYYHVSLTYNEGYVAMVYITKSGTSISNSDDDSAGRTDNSGGDVNART